MFQTIKVHGLLDLKGQYFQRQSPLEFIIVFSSHTMIGPQILMMAQKISHATTKFLNSIEIIFHEFEMRITIDKVYLHQIIASLLSPVVPDLESIPFEEQLQKFPFFKGKIQSLFSDDAGEKVLGSQKDLFKQLERNRIKQMQKSRLQYQHQQRQLTAQLEKQRRQRMHNQRIKRQIQQKLIEKTLINKDYSIKSSCTPNNQLVSSQLNKMKNKQKGLLNTEAVNYLDFRKEKIILRWVKQEIQKGIKMDEQMLMQKALSFSDKIDSAWLEGFMKRFPCLKKLISRGSSADKTKQS